MDSKTLLGLYREMVRIRTTEELVADAYAKQEMRCPVHLSIGQEAVPVGISAHLSNEDKVYSNHRCHAHYLAKGGKIPPMIAELHGKVTGCAKGKGGSMHLVDVEVGMMGSSALVAGTVPLSVGSAFSQSLSGSDRITVGYFGDGGSEEGIFYESMNFAVLHKLPVIFACENNNYATYSPQKARQCRQNIFERGNSFGIAAEHVNGNDVVEVYEAAQRAVSRARNGEGPTLLEFETCRWRDHVGPNYDIEVGYRTQENLDKWMAKCPILKVEKELISEGHLTQDQADDMKTDFEIEVTDAFGFAVESALPKNDEVFEDVYA